MSLGAGAGVGAVWAHHLRSQDMTRSYGMGAPCNIDESRHRHRRKARKSDAADRPSDVGSWPSARCADAPAAFTLVA